MTQSSVSQAKERKGTKWIVKLEVQQNCIEFKVDSSSAVNTLPLNLYNKVAPNLPLKASISKLVGYIGQIIKPKGNATMTIQYKGECPHLYRF